MDNLKPAAFANSGRGVLAFLERALPDSAFPAATPNEAMNK